MSKMDATEAFLVNNRQAISSVSLVKQSVSLLIKILAKYLIVVIYTIPRIQKTYR